MEKIHIIDCGLGNISSVYNAFEKIGATPVVCVRPDELVGAHKIVLPGVGAFGDGMRLLTEMGFRDRLLKKAVEGDIIFGICLGAQLLLDKSYEFGEHEGLGLIAGEVRRINNEMHRLALPHIGWNDTRILKDDPIVEGMNNPSCFYYVNSYYCDCQDQNDIIGVFEYGEQYPGIIRHGNIIGVQAHPEKSQRDGLRLLLNLVAL